MALRDNRSHVSPFHRRRSRSFWGVVFVLFVLFGWVFAVGLCLFCLVCFHDLEINLVVVRSERPSELSWRARHGEKKKSKGSSWLGFTQDACPVSSMHNGFSTP